MGRPRFLTDPDLQLLVFGGKGGVGKTTCAVAAGLQLARRFPETTLSLVSTDPAHSLEDSVAGLQLPDGMEVVEFDAPRHLEEFRRRHGPQLQAIAERGTFLDNEDIGRFLSLSLPGMDELLGFLDLARRAEAAGGRERMVVDTAPSGHALRLLGMPELLRGWIEVLDTLLAKHRYMKQVFARTYLPDELDRFLEELTESVATAEKLLTDPRRCRFVPVMVAEELVVRETAALLDELARLGMAADEIVVNMLAPVSECRTCAGMRRQQVRELGRLPASFHDHALWGTALRPDEVRGPALASFWDDVAPLDPRDAAAESRPAIPKPTGPPGGRSPGTGQLADAPAPLPAAGSRLLLFAGKGGVGKTTLACATALHLARLWPERRLLLFSTDPAHSLADCLDLPVGPRASPVTGNLSALQVDAPGKLASLKQQYRQELDEFFGSLLGGLDLPFDREVMERIVELSPPGLDELMALTEAMDLLEAGTYDLLVLDAAPTGHFVRLLEMPQLVDDWLKAFFELFLKYRGVWGMPRFAERLVQMSRDLHRFRALLRDPERCAVYAAAIPTRMALEETRDLLAACRRLGVNLAALFLNQMTPPSACPFCARRASRERELERDFAHSFPGHRTTVFRQQEPRGPERLEELGAALYGAGPARRGDDARAP